MLICKNEYLKFKLNKAAAEIKERLSCFTRLHLIGCLICRYLVTHLMGADLNNIVKCQKLTDDHVQFLIYQILRGLKVSEALIFNSKLATPKS